MKKLYKVLAIDNWRIANKRLVKKILTEFLYENMLQTEIFKKNSDCYLHRLMITDELHYEFLATPRIFGNWHIHENSIVRRVENASMTDILVSEFIRDTHAIIGIDGLTLGHFLRELNNTLLADCHLLTQRKLNADELVTVPNYQLECHLYGHPWFVINKGRLGFSYEDYLNYSPESYNLIKLAWIAVKRDQVILNTTSQLTYEKLISQELSLIDQNKFCQQLHEYSVLPQDYYFMPIHEWQWQHQIITLYSQAIAQKDIIYLGKSADSYVPTQSIRTFINATNEYKYQIKLPLSIFNTAVYRGLPGERTQLAPMLTDWLQKKLANDDFLQQECRLVLLGEVASIDFPHYDYHHLSNVPYQYKELLGVIWRENVDQYLNPGEKAITMAALIHTDQYNNPFIHSLISASEISIEQWLNEFFTATIPPLLHWLYRYGLVFSPHGENTLLILKNYRPVGLVIKDFIDDVNVSEHNLTELADLPIPLQEVLLQVSDSQITQFIHTGLFVVLYRYLSDILASNMQYPEGLFWQQVHDVICQYQQKHPELSERFIKFDLLKKEFNKMCLNRLRVLSVGYKDYVDRPKVDTIEPMVNPAHPEIFQQWLP